MKRVNLFIAGFVGTLVMTILLYLGPVLGASKLDIAALLGALLGHGVPATLTGRWWMGMVWHALNGVVIFPLIYSIFVHDWLHGSNWLRGSAWGVILWIAMGLVFLPVAGRGLFGDHANSPIIFSLFLNLIYGIIFGSIAGVQVEHPRGIPHPA